MLEIIDEDDDLILCPYDKIRADVLIEKLELSINVDKYYREDFLMELLSMDLPKDVIFQILNLAIKHNDLGRLISYQNLDENTIREIIPFFINSDEESLDHIHVWEMICYKDISSNFIIDYFEYISKDYVCLDALAISNFAKEENVRTVLSLTKDLSKINYICWNNISDMNLSYSFVKEYLPYLNKNILFSNEFLNFEKVSEIYNQYKDLY